MEIEGIEAEEDDFLVVFFDEFVVYFFEIVEFFGDFGFSDLDFTEELDDGGESDGELIDVEFLEEGHSRSDIIYNRYNIRLYLWTSVIFRDDVRGIYYIRDI